MKQPQYFSSKERARHADEVVLYVDSLSDEKLIQEWSAAISAERAEEPLQRYFSTDRVLLTRGALRDRLQDAGLRRPDRLLDDAYRSAVQLIVTGVASTDPWIAIRRHLGVA